MKKPPQYIYLLMFLVFFIVQSMYAVPQVSRVPGDRQDQGDEPFKFFKAGLLRTENNLYDARFILANKEEIGLSNNQEEKIENLMLAIEADTIHQSAEIKIQELRLATFLKSQTKQIDRTQVEKYIREISRMKTTMIVNYMNYLLDIRQILTHSQLQKLKLKLKPGCNLTKF